MELRTGAFLQGGKYRIEKVLGKGGFGITYLAWQKGLNRKVAVKEFFMSEYCNREEDTSHISVPSVGSKEMVDKYRMKFVKEAQTIAELDHPHIVPVYDVFEENGTAYYVMKHFDGGSLSSLVKKGEALPIDLALKYMRQVAGALRYCHDRNVAHLDVKPGNILIQDGLAVLIDFGISKHYNEDGDQTSSTPLGISKGYAPLEQYKRGGVSVFSPVTDIYSLGAVLYRLVIGQTPPDADEVNEDGLPAFPSDVPQYIQDAITAAMQPKKKDRPQSIDDFLALLVEPVVEDLDDDDDSEDTELEEDAEDTTLEKSVCSLIDKQIAKSEEPKNENPSEPRVNNWIHWSVAGAIVAVVIFICILWGTSESSDKRAVAQQDKDRYVELMSSADKLSKDEARLSEAMALYYSASVYETQYAGTRFSGLFNLNALASSVRVQTRMDSIAKVRQQETEERLHRELAVEQKKRETSYNNGILRVKGIEYPMVYISGGSFLMGSEEPTTDAEDERPIHHVTLSGYFIGKYEVTQDLWEAVMKSNPSRFKGSRKPVENVIWDDCQEFIRKLNSLTGQNFRLPTEAQWEFAARGGISSKGYKYSGSNYIDSVGWYSGNGGRKTHEVGMKSPNELGIYDMSGNVEEWCGDWYSSYESFAQTNPIGSFSGKYRVYRGGSWESYFERDCCVTSRGANNPNNRLNRIGLRLCLQ